MPNRTKPGTINFTSVSAAFASGSVGAQETMNIGTPIGFPGTPGPSSMFGNPSNLGGGNSGQNGGNMDIVMGAPTNALAALTASLANPQTLYQMCSDTRRKLKMVQGYERFLALPSTAERLDVVTHVWLSFKLGSSLCHLFNMLLPVLDPHPPTPIPIEFPDFDYPEGNGVFTWALLPQNIKSCKKGAAKFIVKLTELQKEGKWPVEDPLWAVHELLGDDTSGLMKVLRTVNLLLERLPESAWIREDVSPSNAFGQPESTNSGEDNHIDAVDSAFINMGFDSTETSAVLPHTRSMSNAMTSNAQSGHQPSASNGNTHFNDATSKGPRSAAMPLTINTALDNHGNSMPRTASGAYHNSFAGPPTGIDIGPVDVGGAAMHVWEMLKTEKKYVAELEIMQTYAQSLLQQSIVAPDTVHTIFSNIAKLVNFSRRFLTALETEYEPVVEKGGSAWAEGRWGYPFVTYESDFEVYEPYCSNYMSAISLVEKETPNLMRANLSLTVPELTSFLVLPIQRLCRYPLLLEKLSETVASTDYAYKAELADGLEVAKRIAEKVNETLRQHTNHGIVQELESRVKDWKGHHINDFGKLLLDGQFTVTKADMDRDYEVYLFEKMILCCKEVIPDKKDKKNNKSGSILKKDRSSQSMGPKKNLLNLKGRIYVNNLTHIQGVGAEGDYALAVYWRQQEDPNEFENFVLHLKNSEQFQKWHTEISKLMKADHDRREQRQREAESKDRQIRGSAASRMQYPSYFPMTPASDLVTQSATSGGGFFTDDDARGVHDTTLNGSSYSSPPLNTGGSRRTHSQQGVQWASDRYSETSTRSASGDHNGSLAQWRNHSSSPSAPPMPRKMSELSVVTEASFGNPHAVHRNKLSLGKFSTTGDDQPSAMLAPTPENETSSETYHVSPMRCTGGPHAGMFRHVSSTAPSVPHPQMLSVLRMRSASSPQVYQTSGVSDAFYPQHQGHQSTAPQASAASSGSCAPGVPYPSAEPGVRAFHPSKISLAAPDFDPKRSSSSSFSSQPSDDSRPPDTPYSGQGRELRAGDSGESLPAFSRMVIVKVHSDRGVFKLAVPSGIDCDDLKNRVSRKVQMCAGGTIGSQVKCYYRDEEKEKLRLDDDDDLYTLFEPVLRGATREVDLEVKV